MNAIIAKYDIITKYDYIVMYDIIALYDFIVMYDIIFIYDTLSHVRHHVIALYDNFVPFLFRSLSVPPKA